MAANPEDVATLVRKLRSKGLDDAQVTEGLRGMGYSKTDAQSAVGTGSTPKADAVTPAPGSQSPEGGRPATSQPSAPTTGGGFGIPSPSMPQLPSMTLTPPKSIKSGDVGGFLLGLLAYTLALNYLRHGPAGPKAWLGAKFLNKPAALGPSSGASGSSSGAAGAQQTGLTSTRPATPTSV